MTQTSSTSGTYLNLLLKELDTIQDTIKNLDDIIFKSKNFGFLTWGGSLYLVTQHLNIDNDRQKGLLILLTAIIPLLFWAMDYKWRKHILQSSKRLKIISLFLNSDEFKKLAAGEINENVNTQFPFYDPVGWIYTKQALAKDADIHRDRFDPKYMIDEKEFTLRKVLFYKDAYLFYITMMLLSVILGINLVF